MSVASLIGMEVNIWFQSTVEVPCVIHLRVTLFFPYYLFILHSVVLTGTWLTIFSFFLLKAGHKSGVKEGYVKLW